MNWLRMVARAAPLTPISSAKMNRGSSSMLMMPPEPMPIMANRALPWKRSWLFSTSDAVIHGQPIKIRRIYAVE